MIHEDKVEEVPSMLHFFSNIQLDIKRAKNKSTHVAKLPQLNERGYYMSCMLTLRLWHIYMARSLQHTGELTWLG